MPLSSSEPLIPRMDFKQSLPGNSGAWDPRSQPSQLSWSFAIVRTKHGICLPCLARCDPDLAASLIMGWFSFSAVCTIERIYLGVQVSREAQLPSDMHRKGFQAADRQVVILIATNVN